MEKEKLINYLKLGSEIAGGMAGNAIGILGGPITAVIGGGAGVIISKGLIEITDRFLTKRESIRVSAAASFAICEINKQLEKGEKLRNDDFFEKTDKRSKAEELFEGVLLKCKNEYQEKKIKYIANIFSHTVFDESLSASNANQILIVAEGLSYRNLCILSLVGSEFYQNNFNLRNWNYRDKDDYVESVDLELILQDFMDLYNLGLIQNKESAMIAICDVSPGLMKLTKVGKKYYELMALYEIDKKDFSDFIYLLK